MYRKVEHGNGLIGINWIISPTWAPASRERWTIRADAAASVAMTTVNYVSAAAQRAHLPSTSLFNGTGLHSNFPLFSPLSAGHLNIDPAGIASVLTRWAQGKNRRFTTAI
jgi:hypothetical protein